MNADDILSEDTEIDIPGYGEGLDPDRIKLPPYAEDLGGGITHDVDEDGDESWYKDGQLHRDGDLPAAIYSDGYREWYQHGKLHRDGDLPAVVLPGVEEAWYRNGSRHRDGDRPAVVTPGGYKAWYRNGVLHRIGGPAVIRPGRKDEYWVNGKKVPKRDAHIPHTERGR